MVVIESLPESQLAEIRPLLIDLLHNEQERSVLNPLTRDQLERWLPVTRASFEGQNRVFVAREDGGLVGLGHGFDHRILHPSPRYQMRMI